MVNICRKYSKKSIKLQAQKAFFRKIMLFPFFHFFAIIYIKRKNGKTEKIMLSQANMNYLLFIFFYRQRQVEKKNFPFFLFFHVYVY